MNKEKKDKREREREYPPFWKRAFEFVDLAKAKAAVVINMNK